MLMEELVFRMRWLCRRVGSVIGHKGGLVNRLLQNGASNSPKVLAPRIRGPLLFLIQKQFLFLALATIKIKTLVFREVRNQENLVD